MTDKEFDLNEVEKAADAARENLLKTKDEVDTVLKDKEEKRSQTIEVARKTMVGDLRDLVLDILRDKSYTGKSWKDMKEHEQRDVTARIVQRVEFAVVRAIDIIGSDGERHIKAILKQVVVKDGIKAVFECSKSDELRHDLADAQGDTILVVLTNTDSYLGEREKVKFDKDQPELPVGEETPQEENPDAEDIEEHDDNEVSALEKEADELT